MRVLFDTNVVLDLLLDREPFGADATELAATIHYLVTKARGGERARSHVRSLLQIFEVAPVTRPVLEAALELPCPDFEDAVLHEAAREVGAAAIVTRDPADFPPAGLAVFSPRELLAALAAGEA